MNQHIRVIFWPLISTFFIGFFLWLILQIGEQVRWENVLTPITNQFCELDHGGALKQPYNVFTNLSYIFIGFVILQLGLFDLQNPKPDNFLVRFPMFSILLGSSSIYVGLGSTFYHASLTLLSQSIDGSGVMACFLLPTVYMTFRLWSHINVRKSALFILRTYHLVVLFFILTNLLLFIFGAPHRLVGYILTIYTVSIMLFTNFKFKLKFQWKYFFFSLIFIILGKTLWQLDIERVLCGYSELLNFHALWHICSSLSLVFIYLFFRTEQKITESEQVS